jgi:tRNA A-37 threonylcarbamoyl transferase component Bud32
MSQTQNNMIHDEATGVIYADSEARDLLRDYVAELTQGEPAGWSRVKQNASRTVWRREINGTGVYLKQFHSRSLWHRLRRRLGRCDALREFHAARELKAAGVRTADPLAVRGDADMSWLVTREVAPATQADVWHGEQLSQGPQGRQRIQACLRRLARQVARMHNAGILHRDLHCGNVLIDRHLKPVLMDLHRISRSGRLSRRRRAMNLAQLYHDRQYVTTRTERLRFLKTYIRESNQPGTLRGWDLLVETFAHRHTQRQYRQRDKRIRGKNRYFSPIELPGGWRGRVVLASKRRMGGSQAARHTFTLDDWQRILVDPQALLAADEGDRVKDSPSSTIVRKRLTFGEATFDLFIKRSRRRKLLKRLADACRPSRALRAFDLGHQLLTRRIATALPLAAIERRVGPFLVDSILITEAVDAPHLHDFMNTWLSVPPRGDTPLTVPEQRHLAQQVLWELGRVVQSLHDNNFSHRDLKATNIRVRWSLGQRPEIVLVDLDGVARVQFITTRRKWRGLMRLNVSLLQCPPVTHAGRLRMLLGYLRRPGMGRVHFKTWWRVLEDWSARKLSQQIRSRRRKQRALRRST